MQGSVMDDGAGIKALGGLNLVRDSLGQRWWYNTFGSRLFLVNGFPLSLGSLSGCSSCRQSL